MQENKQIKVESYNCDFKQYGDEERLCKKCGYVITSDRKVFKDDRESLEYGIDNQEYNIPDCGINKP